MMKKTILLGTFLLTFFAGFSQAFDDLRMLLIDEKFEKCYKECEKYLDDDETKYHPLVQLYFAMVNYKMSKRNEFAEDYPDADRDALSYASKFVKKDKNGDYANYDLKIRFFEDIKMDYAEQIENYWMEGDDRAFKKAGSLLNKLAKVDPEDAGIELMYAITEMYTGSAYQAKQLVSDAYDKIKAVGVDKPFKDLSASTQYFYRNALMKYAKFRMENENPTGAIEVLTLGHTYFYNESNESKLEYNTDYKNLYDSLNN